MRRIGRACWSCALVVLACGLLAARADETPKPGPQAVNPVDRVLEEWQRKAATIKSVEVRFERTDNDPGWGSKRYEGRAILASPNLALVEFTPVGDKGKVIAIEERLIWNGRSYFQFKMETQKVIRVNFEDEWPAPSLLRIPFFFRMTVEEAKRDFTWNLLKQDQERIILKVAPKAWSADTWWSFQTCYIELDPKTFHPRWIVPHDERTRPRQTFTPTDIKINTVEDTSELREPCLDAWTVSASRYDELMQGMRQFAKWWNGR